MSWSNALVSLSCFLGFGRLTPQWRTNCANTFYYPESFDDPGRSGRDLGVQSWQSRTRKSDVYASGRWNRRLAHQKLGSLDPLALIVNSDGLLTMSTQRVNILYSRFFHLDKFSGRMGETTFRASTLRRLAEKDPELNWDMVTTLWQCESKEAGSK